MTGGRAGHQATQVHRRGNRRPARAWGSAPFLRIPERVVSGSPVTTAPLVPRLLNVNTTPPPPLYKSWRWRPRGLRLGGGLSSHLGPFGLAACRKVAADSPGGCVVIVHLKKIFCKTEPFGWVGQEDYVRK